MEPLFVLILIGLGAGVLSGLVGVGGGIVIVPALVLALGYTQQQAQGTSLAVLMLPVGFAAVIAYHQSEHIRWRDVLIMAIAFVPAAMLGAKLALALSPLVMKRIFGALLLLIALKFLLGK